MGSRTCARDRIHGEPKPGAEYASYPQQVQPDRNDPADRPGPVPGRPLGVWDRGHALEIEYMASRNLEQNMQATLSRSSLTEMIQRIGLDLYREDPWEYGIEDMRSRDLRIERLPPRDFRISFEYSDRLKAQAVVRELSARFNYGPAEALTPASLPEKPSRPDRLAIVAIGLGVGLASGILFAFLRRRGLKWTHLMAGCRGARHQTVGGGPDPLQESAPAQAGLGRRPVGGRFH